MYIILSTYISNFYSNIKLKFYFYATFIFFESYATIHLFKKTLHVFFLIYIF